MTQVTCAGNESIQLMSKVPTFPGADPIQLITRASSKSIDSNQLLTQ